MTTTHKKYSFHVGKDKPNGGQVNENLLKQTIARMFPTSGANIQEQAGTWKGEVESGSWKIEHVDLDRDMTETEANEIKKTLEEKFDQDMVLVTVEEVATV